MAPVGHTLCLVPVGPYPSTLPPNWTPANVLWPPWPSPLSVFVVWQPLCCVRTHLGTRVRAVMATATSRAQLTAVVALRLVVNVGPRARQLATYRLELVTLPLVPL